VFFLSSTSKASTKGTPQFFSRASQPPPRGFFFQPTKVRFPGVSIALWFLLTPALPFHFPCAPGQITPQPRSFFFRLTFLFWPVFFFFWYWASLPVGLGARAGLRFFPPCVQLFCPPRPLHHPTPWCFSPEFYRWRPPSSFP